MTERATGTTTDVPDPAVPEGGRGRRFVASVRRFRARVRRHPVLNVVWRAAIAVVGAAVLVLGILAIPYPGPGWLIVFAGLGILASEFAWAGRLLRFARHYYDRWLAWMGRQSLDRGIGWVHDPPAAQGCDMDWTDGEQVRAPVPVPAIWQPCT